MFQVHKASQTLKATAEAEMDAINALTRRALTPEEVYTFPIRLCDDQPDRDHERFSLNCLKALAPMFLGKPILFDHRWSAHEQTARIYAAELAKEDSTNYLLAKAYLLRLPETESIIAAIEGGILKEVSVGCAVNSVTCSICGELYYGCDHRKGQEYDGKMCVAVLDDPADAYEASFVAVPAQPKAGVQKSAERNEMSTEAADRAKAELRLENLRFGG